MCFKMTHKPMVRQGEKGWQGEGQWTYAVTVAVPTGDTVKIEATAKGHPGNPGVKIVTWTNA